MNALTSLVKRNLLVYFLKRYPSGGNIPRSGPEAESVNCFTVFVQLPNGQERWFLEKLDHDVLHLYRIIAQDNGERRDSRNATLAETHQNAFKINHFKGYLEFNYGSLKDWVVSQLTFYESRHRIRRYALIHFYKQFSGSTKLRFDVLKALIDYDLTSDSVVRQPVDLLHMMDLVYGEDCFIREDNIRLMRRLSLVVDSLVDNGALSKQGNAYLISPKAISLLESYELDKLKFETALRESKKLNYLTTALILVGILQINVIRQWLSDLIIFIFDKL